MGRGWKKKGRRKVGSRSVLSRAISQFLAHNAKHSFLNLKCTFPKKCPYYPPNVLIAVFFLGSMEQELTSKERVIVIALGCVHFVTGKLSLTYFRKSGEERTGRGLGMPYQRKRGKRKWKR